MITGFNTDIEHDGVIYHVQTEDKGLESPLILSLVYAGGAILASKRSPYADLIESGFDEEALAQRVKRQHRLICAAINAGRIEDLKRMGGRVDDQMSSQESSASPELVAEISNDETLEIVTNASDYEAFTSAQRLSQMPVETISDDGESTLTSPAVTDEVEPEDASPPQTAREASPYTVYDSRRESPLGEAAEPDRGLVLTLLEEQDFRAGQTFQIRVLVEDRSGAKAKPLSGVALSVKLLGTAFRPQIYSVKTERDGVAVISAQIPRFTSGRAAVLIRVASGGRTVETRRVIHAA